MKTRTKILFILISITITIMVLGLFNSFGQTTIWSENFTYSNGTKTGTNSKWTTNPVSSTKFAVNTNQFQALNTGSEYLWQSEVIDISAYSNVDFSVYFPLSLNNDNSDYIKLEYKLDNNPITTIYTNADDISPAITRNFSELNSGNKLNGSTLIIYIKALNNKSDEYYYFDNIIVTGFPQTPVAGSATSIGSDGFTANWTGNVNITSYTLDLSLTNPMPIENISENFTGFTVNNGSTDRASTLNTYMQTSGWTGANIYEMTGYSKLGSSSNRGYITSPTIDLSAFGGTAVLQFDLLKYGSDNTVIQVYHAANGSTFSQVGSDITIPTSWTTQTITITGGTANSKIRIYAKSSNRFYLDNVRVTQGSYVSGYENLTVNSTSQIISGLNPNTTYYYRVRGNDGTSTSSNSNVVSVKTLQTEASNHVSSFDAVAAGTGSINLSWTENAGSKSAEGYLLMIYKGNSMSTPFTNPTDGNEIADDLDFSDNLGCINIAAGNFYTLNGLSPNSKYYFQLISKTGTDISTNFKTDGTIPNHFARTKPETPASVSSSEITSKSCKLTWEKPLSGAEYYELDVAKDLGFNQIVTGLQSVNAGDNSEYATSSLDSNTTFYFRIRSVTAGVYSDYENGSFTTYDRPTLAHSIEVYTIAPHHLRIDWTEGNGIKRLVKINSTNNFSRPVDRSDYAPQANTIWQNAGEQVVYDGANSYIVIDCQDYALMNEQIIWIAVFDYLEYTEGNKAQNVKIYNSGQIGNQSGDQGSLPVSLLSYKVTNVNGEIKLEWITASELNNDFFKLERSNDGENFEQIAKINGNGTTNIMTKYSYTDQVNNEGIWYYRLSQYDFDGKSAVCGMVSVVTENTEDNLTAWVENNSLKLNLNSETDENQTIQLINSLGQIVFSKEIELTEGTNNININLPELSGGTYFIKLSNTSTYLIRKVML